MTEPKITASQATAVVRAQFPELVGIRLSELGEGTDFRTFCMGVLYLFRFPKRDDAAAKLVVEARLTAWLAPRLPLAIPLYVYLGQPTDIFPRSFGGYVPLAGTPALFVDPDRIDVTAVGRRLGEFLRCLHGLDVEPAGALGLAPENDTDLEAWSAAALADLRGARQRGYVNAKQEVAWKRIFSTPPSMEGIPARIIHGDLAAEHVLLGKDGGPTAVIDWSDAALGDPARDLAGLIHWGGDAMVSAALDVYGAVDDATLERARWFAACRTLADIEFAHAQQRWEYEAAGHRALARLNDCGLLRRRVHE